MKNENSSHVSVAWCMLRIAVDQITPSRNCRLTRAFYMSYSYLDTRQLIRNFRFVKMAQPCAIPSLQQKMKNLLELVRASPFFSSKFFRRRLEIRLLLNEIAFELKSKFSFIKRDSGTWDTIMAVAGSPRPAFIKRTDFKNALTDIMKLDIQIEHSNKEISHSDWLDATKKVMTMANLLSGSSIVNLCHLLRKMTLDPLTEKHAYTDQLWQNCQHLQTDGDKLQVLVRMFLSIVSEDTRYRATRVRRKIKKHQWKQLKSGDKEVFKVMAVIHKVFIQKQVVLNVDKMIADAIFLRGQRRHEVSHDYTLQHGKSDIEILLSYSSVVLSSSKVSKILLLAFAICSE